MTNEKYIFKMLINWAQRKEGEKSKSRRQQWMEIGVKNEKESEKDRSECLTHVIVHNSEGIRM